MHFGWKFLAVALLGAVVDILWAWHIRALVRNALVMAVSTVVLINYLGFVGHLWFVESPQFSKRFLITTAAALGAAVGTSIVLLADL